MPCLATCGLYDEAGDFAYRVGMPGKSGVGGIMALIPGELSICVWSPELNKAGNSWPGRRRWSCWPSARAAPFLTPLPCIETTPRNE